MTLANFDIYFHMANHYKKIRKAKAVVDCSSPKGYGKKCDCRPIKIQPCPTPPASCTSRNISSCPPESRPIRSICTSRLSDYQRFYSAPPHCKKRDLQDFNPCRRSSRLLSPYGSSLTKVPLPKRNEFSKSKIVKSQVTRSPRDKMEREPSPPGISSQSAKEAKQQTKDKQEAKEKFQKKGHPLQEKTVPQERVDIYDPQPCEYVYFLLKITEDILRNNIYNDADLEKLFESHIDANKGRLDEDKMRAQIDHLKKELLLPLPKKELCQCGDEESDVRSTDCKCCPAYHIDNQGIDVDPNEICSCSNPTCPKNNLIQKQSSENVEGFEEGADKADVSEPVMDKEEQEADEQDIQAEKSDKEEPVQEDEVCTTEVCEQKYGKQSDQNKFTVSSQSGDSNKPSPTQLGQKQSVGSQEPEKLSISSQTSRSDEVIAAAAEEPQQATPESGPQERYQQDNLDKDLSKCVDPEQCRKPFRKSDQKRAQHRHDSTAASRDPQATSVHSMVKIIHQDGPQQDQSQIVLYSPGDDLEQQCFCSVTLQKTALKIQVDDLNEEYVLIDGPVCIPRSMLETKTIRVLIQNVSSMILDSPGQSTISRSNTFSQVNLLEPSQIVPYDENMDSVSGHFDKQGTTGAECAKVPILKKDDQRSVEVSSGTKKCNVTTSGGPKTASAYVLEPENGSASERCSKNKKEPPSRDSAQKEALAQSEEPSREEPQRAKSPVSCTPKKCAARLPTVCSAPCSVGSVAQTDKSVKVNDADEQKIEDAQNEPPSSDVLKVACKPDTCPQKLKRQTQDDTYVCDMKICVEKYPGDVRAVKSDVLDERGGRGVAPEAKKSDTSQDGSEAEKDKSEVPPGDAPSTRRSCDFANKYHYLLMDVSTSTSSCQVYVASPTDEVTSGEKQNEYMLLVDQEYQVDQLDEPELPQELHNEDEQQKMSQGGTDESSRKSSANSENDEDKENEIEIPQQNDIFKYPTMSLGPNANELTYPARRTSDSINERISDIESFRRPSLMVEHEIRAVQPIESNAGSQVLPGLKPSSLSTNSESLRAHEPLKVRYSLNRDLFDQQLPPGNPEVINKLDDLPTIDQDKSKEDNIAAINEKMKEFRKIDEDDNANRRFQITNPENFEIRRVSVLDGGSDESEEEKSKKKKKICCGIGQKDKKKKSAAGASRDATNVPSS